MAEPGNSAHIYHLDDGKFRLTFASTSTGGASFISEIADFTRYEIEEWLKDGHLHPATDFTALLDSFEQQTESNVSLVRGTILRTHFEDEILVKSPVKVEDVCQWMSESQERYFAVRKITIVANISTNQLLKATACFSPTSPDGGSITVSSELLRFCNCLKISVLHELIHANLHGTGKHDPDGDHGQLFKAELKHLMSLGAYDSLL